MSTQDMFRYQSVFGILNRWNFWGVTINTTEPDTQDPMTQGGIASSSGGAASVNTAVKGTARMYNFAGNADDSIPMAHVWLILRRSLTAASRLGPFEIVPYVSRDNECPPENLLRYVECVEPFRMADAHVWDIGYISEPSMRDVPEGIREMAIGLEVTEKVANAAMPSLPQVVMQLGL